MSGTATATATATAAGLRTELRGFRGVQRLSYACAEAVAARLEPCMPFILDTAPVHRGFTTGIGYSRVPARSSRRSWS
ncbi:hypothetical protein [Streptomyces tendae]|uniref:hypothetical protein n=1 Tax=Streptomyces tendae TaxID=1932 RepID=UPI00367C835D